jgi:glycosyltransferase involved in cell wall biosynthesis
MKDHPTFLRAFSHAVRREPRLRTVLVGSGLDARATELVSLIGELAIADKVYLGGERRDLPSLYSALDALCLSSAWGEGFPNVVGEAMSCALPCIATDVGDTAQILDGIGTIVAPRDVAGIATAIERLAAMPETERRLLGTRGRERVIERYSIDAVAAHYESIYETLMNDTPHTSRVNGTSTG